MKRRAGGNKSGDGKGGWLDCARFALKLQRPQGLAGVNARIFPTPRPANGRSKWRFSSIHFRGSAMPKTTPSSRTSSARPSARAEPVTAKQQKIQREQDSKDQAKSAERETTAGKQKKAVQAGAQEYPEPPLPKQHLRKPGLEAEMELKPQFMAPDYKGSGKLEGLTALVTGADSGIGRAVAVLFAREGADVAVAYLSSDQDAKETKRCIEAEGRRCVLIAGDVKDADFCRDAVKKTVKSLGKLDILVNNAAFQEHAESLEDLTEERLDETLRTNVYGYFHMAKAALPHLKQGLLHHQHRFGDRAGGQRQTARLFSHQRRHPRIHQGAGQQPDRQRHTRERCRARPGLDAAEPGRFTADMVQDFGKKTDMRRPGAA
jgi:hypothetical protein